MMMMMISRDTERWTRNEYINISGISSQQSNVKDYVYDICTFLHFLFISFIHYSEHLGKVRTLSNPTLRSPVDEDENLRLYTKMKIFVYIDEEETTY